MIEKEDIKTLVQEESLHTCGCSHSLHTSPKTYCGHSKEQIEESINELFLSVLKRLESEGRLEELIASLNKNKEVHRD